MSAVDLPVWSDDPRAYRNAWARRKRKLDPEFARKQSKSAREWQKANPVRNAWNQYRQSARRRDLEWSLGFEDFENLVSSSCHYCGLAPDVINGVDRVVNSDGYTTNNTVPACSQCNYAKREYSAEEFISWAKRLTAFQES